MARSSEPSKYRLRVTAGSNYDPNTHQIVPVNGDQSLCIENEHAVVSLCVRIQNYRGYPDNSPQTNPYFTHPLHQHDQYSISFAITFKNQPVNGNDLLFGNNFDRPIRDRLPPGFNAALRLVQWTIDPSLDGDAYADTPYLYSPAVATWNQLRIGEKLDLPPNTDTSTNNHNEQAISLPAIHSQIIHEGADGTGANLREQSNIPDTVDKRRAYFQTEEARKNFAFEVGRVYYADFGNGYLDFNNFSLKLPGGFTVNALRHIDEKTHYLRYVLRKRGAEEVYLVVLFTLVHVGDQQEMEGERGGRFEWEAEPSADDVE